jgi:hypothetical protein
MVEVLLIDVYFATRMAVIAIKCAARAWTAGVRARTMIVHDVCGRCVCV